MIFNNFGTVTAFHSQGDGTGASRENINATNKKILRLKYEAGLSQRQIARALNYRFGNSLPSFEARHISKLTNTAYESKAAIILSAIEGAYLLGVTCNENLPKGFAAEQLNSMI